MLCRPRPCRRKPGHPTLPTPTRLPATTRRQSWPVLRRWRPAVPSVCWPLGRQAGFAVRRSVFGRWRASTMTGAGQTPRRQSRGAATGSVAACAVAARGCGDSWVSRSAMGPVGGGPPTGRQCHLRQRPERLLLGQGDLGACQAPASTATREPKDPPRAVHPRGERPSPDSR